MIENRHMKRFDQHLLLALYPWVWFRLNASTVLIIIILFCSLSFSLSPIKSFPNAPFLNRWIKLGFSPRFE
jgi:hypothetical protein